MSDRWEHRFSLHLPNGVILDADDDPPGGGDQAAEAAKGQLDIPQPEQS